MKKRGAATLLSIALLVCATWSCAQGGNPGVKAVMPGESPARAASPEAPGLITSPAMPVEPPGTTGPGDGRKACPQTLYIDCMPTIGKQARPMCSPEYLRWIKENCPDVKVVY